LSSNCLSGERWAESAPASSSSDCRQINRDLIAIFVNQRSLNTEVSIVGPFHNNLCLFRFDSDWVILSTVPGTVVFA
jgi:hypothetical protein